MIYSQDSFRCMDKFSLFLSFLFLIKKYLLVKFEQKNIDLDN